MKAEEEDKIVGELMQKSARPMPFSDFEHKLMAQINEEALFRKRLIKDVKLSWFFLIIGLFLGMFLSSFFIQLHTVIFGISARTLILLIQAFFIVILLTQFDRLHELTRKKE
jgi:hypothetical protein